jgi:hypothetical protein
MTVKQFKTENPSWKDISDDYVEKTYAYARWRLGKAAARLGRTLRRVLLIEPARAHIGE